MPLWTVQWADGDDDQVDAEMLAMEGGVLVALSDDGLLVQAWAVDQWRTVRLVAAVEADPLALGAEATVGDGFGDNVLVGLPRLTQGGRR